MKKIHFFVVTFIAVLAVSCGNDEAASKLEDAKIVDPKSHLLTSIAGIEKKMHSSPQIDNIIAGQALQLYFEYTTNYPTDPATPDYLFKSGEIATAIQQYPQAYSYYKTICEKHPSYKLIEQSYFLLASVLDNYLNEDEKARKVYTQLINLFPNSKYVNDAKAAINNLGKSDEELIKEFQKKNGGK